ncbi:hypothetical protein KAR52_03290 [Candidatus Pacearchaeota archaeon]|nr:hypothetical protein [Candidatus Pacearchaeota archaeon]
MISKRRVKQYEGEVDKYLKRAHEYEESIYRQAGKISVEKIDSLIDRAILKYEQVIDIYKSIGDFKKAKKIEGDISRLRKPSSSQKPLKKRGLEKYLNFANLTIASLLASLFFISSNFTGYVIGGQPQDSPKFVALGLFGLSVVFSFFYFKSKK